MAALSDLIEGFIKKKLQEEAVLEIKRNEMALHFDCAPSQINYVLASRFTIENGYAVQSRRGGGGYVRIIRLTLDDKNQYLLHILSYLEGELLSYKEAMRLIEGLRQRKLISEREAAIFQGMIQPDAFLCASQHDQDKMRSLLVKSALKVLMKQAKCHGCPACKEQFGS